MLSVWIVAISFLGKRHDSVDGTAKGFYSFFEPRFKVDSKPRGCLARYQKW